MPGNVDPKPDTQLMSLIHNPEPVRGVLAPFDLETLRDSFTLLPGSPPGFDPARLYGTDDGAAKFVNTVNSRAHANTGVGSTFIPREQQPRAPESSLDTRPSQGGFLIEMLFLEKKVMWDGAHIPCLIASSGSG
ncbi:hypothetical protein BC936DRAFT_136909 [Jimgerdemannia flammicorona]|uniref:Uncharacterized protein n=1 Tax=Jimgerdemannia flammicorona TaxID=994334 RepID=A0A433CYI2_9FUNG|nr:hypothetical protein BC936DRAFT_136909 [Jimgerdemannia flammicorona]